MVIGISGSSGAGKDTVVQILKERGFVHCSARDIFLEELRARGIGEPDRVQIAGMANELRAQHGVAYVIDTYVARFDPAVLDVVIESIYTLGEVDRIRELGGYLVAVDADPGLRYERIVHRMSETDRITKEEFLKKQEEDSHSTDPVKQNSRTVMEQADFTICNEGTFEELKVQVEYMLEKMGRK